MWVSVVILGILAAWFVGNNPFLFGRSVASSDEYADLVVAHQEILDGELDSLRQEIGDEDFPKYRNHCLRAYIFAQYFLGQDDVVKAIPNASKIMAVALAYHDVALWTDHALDYLDPSAAQMEQHLSKNYEDPLLLSQEEQEIAKAIILEHHKVTNYTQGKNASVNALVNAVRKGDWADLTFGIVRWDLPSGLLQAAYDQVPELGFHAMLGNMGGRLSPDNFVKRLDVLKILKW